MDTTLTADSTETEAAVEVMEQVVEGMTLSKVLYGILLLAICVVVVKVVTLPGGDDAGERLGQDVLLAQLGSLIYSCTGVENYKIVSPAADVAIEADQLPVLTSISVEAMTA